MKDPIPLFSKKFTEVMRKEEDPSICHGRPWRETLTEEERSCMDFCVDTVKSGYAMLVVEKAVLVVAKLAGLLDQMQGTPVTEGNHDT